MAESVGIMGGTFDPIHCGHLAAAEEARVQLGLTRVIFVPNHHPPHKKDYEVSPAEVRYEMVVLATASNPHFEVSRVELDRPGPSYSVDTVARIKATLAAEARLYFITGADAVLDLSTWREPERLAELCELVAVLRPGYELSALEKALGPKLAKQVHILHVPGVEVSSTDLRKRAATGASLRYLTPAPVAQYISCRRLYAAPGTILCPASTAQEGGRPKYRRDNTDH